MKNNVNVYTCSHGHKTVTVDLVEGTTPFMIGCRHIPLDFECGDMAKSCFYRCDQTLTPEYEWYKPDSLKGLDTWEKDHVEKGGLILRKIAK